MGFNEYKNPVDTFNNDNVLPDIKLLLSNIPNDLSPLEKVRWIYINLGKLFSYDYRVANNSYYGYDKKVDMNSFVGRYQTCIQISEILNNILNNIDNVQSKIVPRVVNTRGNYGNDHLANEVIINDNGYEYKLILDLTLDLYLIQSDCRTAHFGYQSDEYSQYDIISLYEDALMDKKLGFINDSKDYTDYQIDAVRKEIDNTKFNNYSDEEFVRYHMLMINKLYKKFPGHHEGKQYCNMLFSKLLDCDFREFSLYFKDGENTSLCTIYHVTRYDHDSWILYSNKLGFVFTDINNVKEMLNDGWFSKSNTLLNYVYNGEKPQRR